MVPKLKSTIVPISTVQAASEPLSERQLQEIMPGWTTLADTRRAIIYTRRTGKNRITLGALARNFGVVKDEDRNRIHVGLNQMFPQLRGLKWDYYWSGLVAATIEHLHHFHEPLPGVFAGLGGNGRGVAMSMVMGRALAERVMGADQKTLPFPTIPMKADPYGLTGRWGMRIAVGYFEAMDAVDSYRNKGQLRQPI